MQGTWAALVMYTAVYAGLISFTGDLAPTGAVGQARKIAWFAVRHALEHLPGWRVTKAELHEDDEGSEDPLEPLRQIYRADR